MALQGGKLAGGNPKNQRVENDYYATNPLAVEMLLEQYKTEKIFNTNKQIEILEPCVGEGHICKGLYNYIKTNRPLTFNQLNLTTLDIVDRNFPKTIIQDFLKWETDKKFDMIITNPPYSLAMEFCEKGIELLKNKGCMAMFLKIQFLESEKRKEFFAKFPPKYIYVFSNRMATWNNGKETDENGKHWATTMCHAWFVWEKGSLTEPIVRWL